MLVFLREMTIIVKQRGFPRGAEAPVKHEKSGAFAACLCNMAVFS